MPNRTRIRRRAHAKQRLAERFGLNLSQPQYKNFLKQVNSYEVIAEISNTTDIRLGVFEGKELIPVYNKKLGQVKTVLDRRMYMRGVNIGKYKTVYKRLEVIGNEKQ